MTGPGHDPRDCDLDDEFQSWQRPRPVRGRSAILILLALLILIAGAVFGGRP